MKDWFRSARRRIKASFRPPASILDVYRKGTKEYVVPTIELAVIVFAAMWIGREYLSFDPSIVPRGRELLSAISTHNFWNNVAECGWCALWNGSAAGGYPALSEIYGPPAHPLVALTTLRWGVINGMKVGVIISLAIAGFAQWWLARVLKVGWIPRMWSALTALAGGHLAGRMELGIFGVLLSTAMASLVIPAVLTVSKRSRRPRDVVILGVTLALLAVAGQGYIQIAFLFTLPAMAFLLLEKDLRPRPAWKDYLKSAVLGSLLAAPLLVPLFHFLPQFGKWLDPDFGALQPLKYLPLNLVIDDPAYYYADGILGKLPYPNLYTLYIGWPAVLLAVFGVASVKIKDLRTVLYLTASALLVFLTASGELLRYVIGLLPAVAGLRFGSLMAGLSIPFILGLSAYGLDRLLNLSWPTLSLQLPWNGGESEARLSLHWLLIIPLVLAVRSNFAFASSWLMVDRVHELTYPIIDALETEGLSWVNVPFGEHLFITPAMVREHKIAEPNMPWVWVDRQFPPARRVATRGEEPPTPNMERVAKVGDISIFEDKDVHYAAIHHAEGITPCYAEGDGGDLNVSCSADFAGRLVVMEHKWPGWRAWRDGRELDLQPGQWLTVEANPGEAVYEFRYRPADVFIGIGLFFLGAMLALFWLISDRRRTSASADRSPSPPMTAPGDGGV